MLNAWVSILEDILDGKDSMKQKKAVKRAVKRAQNTPYFPLNDTPDLMGSLTNALASGSLKSFTVKDGRVFKEQIPSQRITDDTATIDPSDTKKQKNKKGEREDTKAIKKKRKESTPSEENKDTSNIEELEEQKIHIKKSKKVKKSTTITDPSSSQQPQPTIKPITSPPTNTPAVPTTNDEAWRASNKREDVKSGLYSTAEKETLKAAVIQQAQLRGFSTTDFSWLIADGKGHRPKDVLGLWKEVAAHLPQRTIKSVASAGVRIFHPYNYKGPFSPEEDARLLALVEQMGTKWTAIGGILERTNVACKDRYREVCLGDKKKKGAWSIDEENRLVKAVDEYQKMRRQHSNQVGCTPEGDTGNNNNNINNTNSTDGATLVSLAHATSQPSAYSSLASTPIPPVSSKKEQTRLDRRDVLDDINWDVISKTVSTRSAHQCLEKWYNKLRPSMVDSGEWGSGDDRRMLRALWSLQASAEYEVPWDVLVKERTAPQSKRRWKLMAKTVPEYREKSFGEIVEFLVGMHMPQLKEKGKEENEKL